MDKKLPLVTVVIPCYNHAQYVQESIQSVIDQDYDNIELIIIDDGSKDNSVEKIQEMVSACEERFKRFEFRFRPNKGLCATLNEALDWSCGGYFSPIASDDIMLPHKISFLVDKIKQTNAPAVFGSVRQIGSKQGVIGVFVESRATFADVILRKLILPAAGSLVSVEMVRKVGSYDEKIKLEDWFMWLKLTEGGSSLVIYPEVVAKYRRHETNTVNDIRSMRNWRVQVLEKFKNNSFYDDAIVETALVYADALVDTNRAESLRVLISQKTLSFRVLKLFLKAVMPRSVLKMKRKLIFFITDFQMRR